MPEYILKEAHRYAVKRITAKSYKDAIKQADQWIKQTYELLQSNRDHKVTCEIFAITKNLVDVSDDDIMIRVNPTKHIVSVPGNTMKESLSNIRITYDRADSSLIFKVGDGIEDSNAFILACIEEFTRVIHNRKGNSYRIDLRDLKAERADDVDIFYETYVEIDKWNEETKSYESHKNVFVSNWRHIV